MIDLSGVIYALPIFSFVFVFAIMFAVLKSTKILGDNAAIMGCVSFAIAIIFISFSQVRSYLESVTSGFVVLFIAMFFIILLGTFALGKDVSAILKPGLVWVFVITLALIFIFVGYFHFNLDSSLPIGEIKNFLFDSQYSGSLLLGIVALVVGLVIVKK